MLDLPVVIKRDVWMHLLVLRHLKPLGQKLEGSSRKAVALCLPCFDAAKCRAWCCEHC